MRKLRCTKRMFNPTSMDQSSINNYQQREIRDIIKNIISDENVIDPQVDIKQGNERGDNFTSLMKIVDVKGKNKSLHLILKFAPRNSATRDLIRSDLFFAQEIYFYNKVLPAIENIQKEKAIENPFIAFPKCYKTVDTLGKEVLVLENLKELSYIMADRKENMDERHVLLVLEEYAKFHAVSFALKDQKPELFSNLIKGFFDVFSTQSIRSELFDVLVGCVDILKPLFAEETDLKLIEMVNGLKDGVVPFFKKLHDFPKENGIIVHGDAWSNNMMFKYENQSNIQVPTKVCLFDFQISKVLPPVIDISYLLYSSAPIPILDELEKYLGIYHRSLKLYLQLLGSNADEIYPFTKLMDDWKEFSKFGFIMSLLVTRLMLREDDEIKGFDDAIAENKKPYEIFVSKYRNEELINERSKYLVMHMYKNCYL